MDLQNIWQEIDLLKNKLRDLQESTVRLENQVRQASGQSPTSAVAKAAPAGIPLAASHAKSDSVHTASAPAARPVSSRNMENEVGMRWLVVTGVIALIIAVGYAIRLGIEQGWFTVELRCAAAALLGAALFGVGYHLRDKYARYGEVLMSGGVVSLFLSIYAAHALYHIMSGPEALAGILVIAFGSALLSWRASAHLPLYLGMVFCYLSPLLVDSLGQSLTAFLTFLAVLNTAYLILSLAIDLPPLLIACLYLATTLYISAWYGKFSRPTEFWQLALGYQIFQALTFGLGATLPALSRGQNLSRAMTWALLPVILVCYFLSSDILQMYARAWHVPFALLTAAFFFGLAQFGRVRLQDDFIVHEPTQMTLLAGSVIGIHLLFEHTRGLEQTWGFFLGFYALAFLWNAMKRPASLLLVLLGLFMTLMLKLNFDMGYSLEQKQALSAFMNQQFFMLAILGLSFNFSAAREIENSGDMADTFLCIGHALVLRALYLQVEIMQVATYGSLWVSIFWLAYASVVLALGFWRDLPAVRRSALWIFAFCTFKVFLYDTLAASRIVKTASYFILGVTLILAGYVYQRIKIKTVSR